MWQVFLATLWLSTSAFASLLPHASAVMTHLICESNTVPFSLLLLLLPGCSWEGYEVRGWSKSLTLFSSPFFPSVFTVSCAFTYWSIFMLVFVTLFYVPHSYLCLFIFIWLSVILLSGFALIRPLLVSEAIFTHTSVFFAQFPLFICSK